jgi:hypothetical protein
MLRLARRMLCVGERRATLRPDRKQRINATEFRLLKIGEANIVGSLRPCDAPASLT